MFQVKNRGPPINLGDDENNDSVIQNWKDLFTETSKNVIDKNLFITYVIQTKNAQKNIILTRSILPVNWKFAAAFN